jgi:hypothetical protein
VVQLRAAWAVAYCERLHAQYMHMAERLGGLLEQEGRMSEVS